MELVQFNSNSQSQTEKEPMSARHDIPVDLLLDYIRPLDSTQARAYNQPDRDFTFQESGKAKAIEISGGTSQDPSST